MTDALARLLIGENLGGYRLPRSGAGEGDPHSKGVLLLPFSDHGFSIRASEIVSENRRSASSRQVGAALQAVLRASRPVDDPAPATESARA